MHFEQKRGKLLQNQEFIAKENIDLEKNYVRKQFIVQLIIGSEF